MSRLSEALRSLPAVTRLLEEPVLAEAVAKYGRAAATSGARAVLDEARRALLNAESQQALAELPATAIPLPNWQDLAKQAAQHAENRRRGGIRRVINATGVILHTGLGRAVLPPAALKELCAELGGYANVEFELATGQRGQRDKRTGELLCMLLNCEAGLAVNNNAAATMLALAALARGKEVIVSRGQLVEIGGGFRVPDVLRESGAKLVEVGTTNRTRISDYAHAITPETGLLLRVHSSNFRMVGFTEEVSIAELAGLGRARGIPVLDDIGSGCLEAGLADELRAEPTVKDSLRDGADVLCFSADKILGGPQAGLIIGRKLLLEKIAKHPLYRAFRLDKLILRALETTLALYLDPDTREQTVPTLRMLRKSLVRIGQEAEELAQQIRALSSDWEAETDRDSSRLGSGSLPERDIPTRVVCLRRRGWNATELSARLRALPVPVVGRIQDDRLLLDPRTLLDGEAHELLKGLLTIT